MRSKERELAKLTHKKNLNWHKWHIPEAIEMLFTELLCSDRYHASQLIKFCIEVDNLIQKSLVATGPQARR